MASALVAANSCDVLAYNKRLFDITLVIRPPQAQTSSVIVSRNLLYTMIGDSGACGGQITKVIYSQIMATERNGLGTTPMMRKLTQVGLISFISICSNDPMHCLRMSASLEIDDKLPAEVLTLNQ